MKLLSYDRSLWQLFSHCTLTDLWLCICIYAYIVIYYMNSKDGFYKPVDKNSYYQSYI